MRCPPKLLRIVFLVMALTGIGHAFAFGTNNGPTNSAPDISKSIVTKLDPTTELGHWIWDGKTYDKQSCQLWRSFEIRKNASVLRATLKISADNGFSLYLDGREIGRGSDWRTLSVYDLTWVLTPGPHVIAVEGFNDTDKAGVIAGLKVDYTDGNVMEIGSDHNWRVVPPGEHGWRTETAPSPGWPQATVVGQLGMFPWWRVPTSIVVGPPVQPLLVHFWATGWFQIILVVVCVTVMLICLRLAAQLTLQSRAQRLLQLERARIARDIHDELGAGLTQLVLLGEVAQSELPVSSATRTQIDQICERARDLSQTMDEIVWAINSRRDTLRDFANYMCKYAQGFLGPTSIRCRLDVEPDLPTMVFDLPIRRNLFLAVKEALNNAAKHSSATELFLRIHRAGQGLIVVVEDDGVGFDLARANPERNGLTNMTLRMNEVGGGCRVTGTPAGGCRVEFTIPLLHTPQKPGWFAPLFGGKSPVIKAGAELPLLPTPANHTKA